MTLTFLLLLQVILYSTVHQMYHYHYKVMHVGKNNHFIFTPTAKIDTVTVTVHFMCNFRRFQRCFYFSLFNLLIYSFFCFFFFALFSSFSLPSISLSHINQFNQSTTKRISLGFIFFFIGFFCKSVNLFVLDFLL